MRLYRATFSFMVRDDGWPLFLVSPNSLTRLNKALLECRSAGGQHE